MEALRLVYKRAGRGWPLAVESNSRSGESNSELAVADVAVEKLPRHKSAEIKSCQDAPLGSPGHYLSPKFGLIRSPVQSHSQL
jgi:hypothetical protein